MYSIDGSLCDYLTKNRMFEDGRVFLARNDRVDVFGSNNTSEEVVNIEFPSENAHIAITSNAMETYLRVSGFEDFEDHSAAFTLEKVRESNIVETFDSVDIDEMVLYRYYSGFSSIGEGLTDANVTLLVPYCQNRIAEIRILRTAAQVVGRFSSGKDMYEDSELGRMLRDLCAFFYFL